MKNRNTFNQTPFLDQMDAAKTMLDLTLAIARLTLRIEEYYELEPEAA